MRLVWYVALGGAFGSAARYLLSVAVQTRVPTIMPLGTLVINISGSLLLGFLLRYSLGAPVVSPEVRALLTTGFCGGYTTFSTFSFEAAALIEGQDYYRAGAYIGLSVLCSLMGTFIGFAAARILLAAQHAA